MRHAFGVLKRAAEGHSKCRQSTPKHAWQSFSIAQADNSTLRYFRSNRKDAPLDFHQTLPGEKCLRQMFASNLWRFL